MDCGVAPGPAPVGGVENFYTSPPPSRPVPLNRLILLSFHFLARKLLIVSQRTEEES
jgi:hypothetical protein